MPLLAPVITTTLPSVPDITFSFSFSDPERNGTLRGQNVECLAVRENLLDRFTMCPRPRLLTLPSDPDPPEARRSTSVLSTDAVRSNNGQNQPNPARSVRPVLVGWQMRHTLTGASIPVDGAMSVD
jgi:hypothetical protein